MTESPGQGCSSHSCTSGSPVLMGSLCSSNNNRFKSTPSDEPCFKTFAGNTTRPAMRTLMLASRRRENPDMRQLQGADGRRGSSGRTPPTGWVFGAGHRMSDVSAVLGSFCQNLDFGTRLYI